MKYNYAYIKLFFAIEHMTTARGSRKEQLLAVYQSYLHVLNESDFPDSVKVTWQYFKENISNKGAPDGYDPENKQGRVYWTIRQMGWQKTEKMTQALWDLYKALSEETHTWRLSESESN